MYSLNSYVFWENKQEVYGHWAKMAWSMEKPISRWQSKESWHKSHMTMRILEMCFGKPGND